MQKKAVSLFTLMFFSAGLILCACLQANPAPHPEKNAAASHCHSEEENSSAPAAGQSEACCSHCQTEKGFVLPADLTWSQAGLHGLLSPVKLFGDEQGLQQSLTVNLPGSKETGPPGEAVSFHFLSASPLYIFLRTLLI